MKKHIYHNNNSNMNRLQFYPLNNLTPLFHTGSLAFVCFCHTAIFMLSELIPMNNETQTSYEQRNNDDDDDGDGLKPFVW